MIGTGFIGLEVAASLRALDVAVTLATGGRPLFGAFGSADFSAYLDGLYREQRRRAPRRGAGRAPTP